MVESKPKVQVAESKTEMVSEEKKVDSKVEAVVHEQVAEVKSKEEKDADAAKEKLNNEVMAAQAKLRPTPTPEEVRLALDGKNVDLKEDHGAPEQHVHLKKEL